MPKIDYRKHPVIVTDTNWNGHFIYGSAQSLADTAGAQSYPVAGTGWFRADAPREGKAAVVCFDYGRAVRVAALAHYFYVPGCRDHRLPYWGNYLTGSSIPDWRRWADYLSSPHASDIFSGPSAFSEVKIYVSDDSQTFKQVAHLKDLPEGCPQLLKIRNPVKARFLKLEVISLVEGAGALRSYEIETYIDKAPDSLPSTDEGKAIKRGFPDKSMLEAAEKQFIGKLSLNKDKQTILFTLPTYGLDSPLAGQIEISVDGKAVKWDSLKNDIAAGGVVGRKLRTKGEYVKAGLLLNFDWAGRTNPRYPKLEIRAKMDCAIKQWFIPAYHSSNQAPEKKIEIPTPVLSTCVSLVSDNEKCLGIVPDTDESYLGIDGDWITVAYPLRGCSLQLLLLAVSGDCLAGFRKVIADVFDFNEPRQFSPVSKAIPELCRFLDSLALWSDKYQMVRAFPDIDFFHIFYCLPHIIPAFCYWRIMSEDSVIDRKIDAIIRFTLARRFVNGAMKGAIFSEYADRKLCDTAQIPTSPYPIPYYYTDEQLVGLDQANNRWVTAHTMGGVLWAMTFLWRARGNLAQDIIEGAKEIADWMLRFQRLDGSWAYAYNPDGTVASPSSGSGSIWGIWALYRLAKLTGEEKYMQAAKKAKQYFKNTFTANHTYRGYWEDNYVGGKSELNTAQGFESTIAAMAFAEMEEQEAMISSSMDSLRFICTRTLESRTYFTSYGGAAEQQGWAPGTYMAPTFGLAAYIAWRRSGNDFLKRFASLAKTIGWWQDPRNGGAVWLLEAITQNPIEIYHDGGGQRYYWAQWDSAHKVSFALPWLIDEVNRRSGDRFKINLETLQGKDDRNTEFIVREFKGAVNSKSGQVNWVWFEQIKGRGKKQYQLALINHAEETEVSLKLPEGYKTIFARLFDSRFDLRQADMKKKKAETEMKLPADSLTILVCEKEPH